MMVRKSKSSSCHSFYEFYLHTAFRLSKSAPPNSVWLGRVAGLIGIDHFPFDTLEGNSTFVDNPFVGIIYRIINPRSDYQFIHRRPVARRFRLALAELSSRYFARFFDDALLRSFLDTRWRIPRATRCGSAWTLCRRLHAARGTLTVYSARLNFHY